MKDSGTYKNHNLTLAKKAKNDEFYTRFADIESEMCHYAEHFRDKVVYCNCDNPQKSDFVKYFVLNFNKLGLKKLIATCCRSIVNVCAYKFELTERSEPVTDFEAWMYEHGRLSVLEGDGSYKSDECLALLDESDVVVTNPPFSLFRDFVSVLVEHQKQFIIIGPMHAISYKDIFPLLKSNALWLGYNHPNTFIEPDGRAKKFGNIRWYTNVMTEKILKPIELTAHYEADRYPCYDNADAIDVDRMKNIPMDYDGEMGVPMTFFDTYCITQFEIVGISMGDDGSQLRYTVKSDVDGEEDKVVRPFVRVLIRRKS